MSAVVAAAAAGVAKIMGRDGCVSDTSEKKQEENRRIRRHLCLLIIYIQFMYNVCTNRHAHFADSLHKLSACKERGKQSYGMLRKTVS
jgi:hypothetical protein